MSLYRPLALVAAIALLGGCATMPQPLQGNYADVTSASVQPGSASGTRVRWGGEIIKTEPGPQETCFYILGRRLDIQARPELGNTGDSQGRFVACHNGFYDPEVFTRGRELTVTGTLEGTVTKKVGDYSYPYPRVKADVVYLWPKRPIYVGTPYPPGFYDPYWGGPWGWGYGPWGGWGGGYWGGPRVIVVRPSPAPSAPPHR